MGTKQLLVTGGGLAEDGEWVLNADGSDGQYWSIPVDMATVRAMAQEGYIELDAHTQHILAGYAPPIQGVDVTPLEGDDAQAVIDAATGG